MKSRMMSFASVLTLGGILAGWSLAVFFLMSAMSISYGVNSNSVGVLEPVTFFSLIPCLSSPITSVQMLASIFVHLRFLHRHNVQKNDQ